LIEGDANTIFSQARVSVRLRSNHIHQCLCPL
jgi:hypothetical protein